VASKSPFDRRRERLLRLSLRCTGRRWRPGRLHRIHLVFRQPDGTIANQLVDVLPGESFLHSDWHGFLRLFSALLRHGHGEDVSIKLNDARDVQFNDRGQLPLLCQQQNEPLQWRVNDFKIFVRY